MKTPTLNDEPAKPRTMRRVFSMTLNVVACVVLVAVIAGVMWATWLPALTAGKR